MSDGSGTTYIPTQKALDDPSFLVGLLGPEEAARLCRTLTPGEERRVDEVLARHGGDPVAALGMQHLPADVQSEIRRVMA